MVEGKPCPEEAAGLLSRLVYSWLAPLIYLATRKQLQPDDLPRVARSDEARIFGEEFEAMWRLFGSGTAAPRVLQGKLEDALVLTKTDLPPLSSLQSES